ERLRETGRDGLARVPAGEQQREPDDDQADSEDAIPLHGVLLRADDSRRARGPRRPRAAGRVSLVPLPQEEPEEAARLRFAGPVLGELLQGLERRLVLLQGVAPFVAPVVAVVLDERPHETRVEAAELVDARALLRRELAHPPDLGVVADQQVEAAV